MTKDFNVKVTIRNSRLLRLIESKFGTQAEFARQAGIGYPTVAALMTFRISPIGKKGWTGTAEKIASFLGVYPSDIWPEHLQEVRLKSATADFDLDQAEVQNTIAHGQDHTKQIEQREIISKLKEILPQRSADFIEWRLTDGADATYDECGEVLGGVTSVRARQIEMKAFRKMREKAVYIGIRPEGLFE